MCCHSDVKIMVGWSYGTVDPTQDLHNFGLKFHHAYANCIINFFVYKMGIINREILLHTHSVFEKSLNVLRQTNKKQSNHCNTCLLVWNKFFIWIVTKWNLCISTQKGKSAVLYIKMVIIYRKSCILHSMCNLRNFQGQFWWYSIFIFHADFRIQSSDEKWLHIYRVVKTWWKWHI